MASIIEVDRSGRLLIPKRLREELGITENTQLLAAKAGEGRLLLQVIDEKEIARRITEETKDQDPEDLFRQVRKETDARIREAYPSLRRR
jgi:AbrB family looped-hinge helix DNA binding protein